MNSTLSFLSILFIPSIIGNELSEILSEPLALDISMDSLNEKLKGLESVMKHQEERIIELETTVETQQTLIQDMECSKTIKERRALPSSVPHAAFSAYLDHQQTHTQIDQIVKFNKFLLNDGNHYSSLTGIFSAPVNGTYLFSYMVNTEVTNNQLMVKLVVDGINESDAVSDPFHSLQELQGGNTVIMHVNAGQAVWLAAYNTGNVKVDGRPSNRFSTFSGVLLYQ